MQRMFPAKPAVLIHFQPVRIVFLIFHSIIVSLLALGTSQCNLNSHCVTPLICVRTTATRNSTILFKLLCYLWAIFILRFKCSKIQRRSLRDACLLKKTICCPQENELSLRNKNFTHKKKPYMESRI